MRLIERRRMMLGLGLAPLAASTALAQPQPLAAPGGRVILTVSGRIGVTNEGSSARFDRAMLEEIGMASFTTATPWYDGPVTFEGVPMTKLLQRVGAQGEMVQAVALNDYSTEIPIADFAQYNVLLALKREGNYLTIRDKGPLFIVYPYDSDPALKSPRYYGRSAWQVARLVVH